MNSVDVRVLNFIFSLFYRIGFWHRGDEASASDMRIKRFYLIYYSLFPLSILAGTIFPYGLNYTGIEMCIFLLRESIAASILLFNLHVLMFKKNEILEMFQQINVYQIESHTKIGKSMRLKKFVNILYFLVLNATISCQFIYMFPFDYFGYWMSRVFILTELVLSIIIFLFSVPIWYLTTNCALRYEELGYQLRKIGHEGRIEVTSNESKENLVNHEYFLRELTSSINSHQQLRKYFYQILYKIKIFTNSSLNRSATQVKSFLCYTFWLRTSAVFFSILCLMLVSIVL